MTDTITTQLVGAHFRPPAKALLAFLPAGCPLALRPEPQNEYDANAVQVLLRTSILSPILDHEAVRDEAEQQLAGAGFDIQSIREAEEWHLGYLPRAAKGNAVLEAWNVEVQRAIHAICQPIRGEPEDGFGDENPTIACTLSFDSSGKPSVIIPWPPKVEG
jgi:hypothetical protein